MIRNFVFDVGNVLANFRYRDYMQDLGFSGETVLFTGIDSLREELRNLGVAIT